MKKRKGKDIEELGVFNVLLIGDNAHSVSIADNIKARFSDSFSFNIVSDIDSDGKRSNSWFNEFIFDLTTTCGRYNNIVVSRKFKEWMGNGHYGRSSMECLYMKKLLQAMNFIIVDTSEDGGHITFDDSIPQYAFDVNVDFGEDLFKWIGEQIWKMKERLPTIRLVRSLCGKSIPYLGDIFTTFSGKKWENIVCSDKMRFDVPILFDEFCHLAKGHDLDYLDKTIFTRTNSALSVFFK